MNSLVNRYVVGWGRLLQTNFEINFVISKENDKIWINLFEAIFSINYVANYKTIHVNYLNKSHDLLKKLYD